MRKIYIANWSEQILTYRKNIQIILHSEKDIGVLELIKKEHQI